MTTKERSEEAAKRRPSSAGQWLIGLFVVLALVASLLMVIGDNFSVPATLAVIAALWAAVIGAVLVTKYRRQADVAESRSRDLRLVYELQLEREIAARRQYESDVETAIRQEIAAESNVELEELKAQVLALRASLEQLLGTPLPDMRAAIGLERPRELGSGLAGAGYAAASADDRVAAERDFATTAPPSDPGRHVPEEPQDVEEVDPGELTEIIPVVTDDPGDAASPEPQTETGPIERVAYGAQAYEPPAVPPTAPQQPAAPEPEPQPQGRRAAPSSDDGAHSAGRPASELLSQLRASSAENRGRGGRRRRD
ncbi:hypothetical protein Y710_01870 [Gordonia sp. QH-12]|uniref:DUF6779 domain-containing protein n=1 Tax=Gordonia sp. QH-12 TaxID=1437876 RepID=UPI000780651B|nr:DUF6779 domain-containing protein [Gordonia sp. QH-12]KXT58644.1 hypothetical protein Y710_01870 [Gordonia sp. QH-12]